MNIKEIIFPKTLSSKRLLLRTLTDEDKGSIFEIYSDEETAKYDDWIPMKKVAQAQRLIDNSNKYFNEKSLLRYGIVLKESNMLIGSCALFDFDEWNKKCSIFYQINRNYWNKGYASEAIKLLVKFAFEELHTNRIEAFITPGNDASQKVLEKNGFIREGLMREMEFYKDKFWDGIVMGMLKKDYER